MAHNIKQDTMSQKIITIEMEFYFISGDSSGEFKEINLVRVFAIVFIS